MDCPLLLVTVAIRKSRNKVEAEQVRVNMRIKIRKYFLHPRVETGRIN